MEGGYIFFELFEPELPLGQKPRRCSEMMFPLGIILILNRQWLDTCIHVKPVKIGVQISKRYRITYAAVYIENNRRGISARNDDATSEQWRLAEVKWPYKIADHPVCFPDAACYFFNGDAYLIVYLLETGPVMQLKCCS